MLALSDANKQKGKTKTRRKYPASDLKIAVESILNNTMTKYRAAQIYKIRKSTLQEHVERFKSLLENNKDAEFKMTKIGRPSIR